MVCDSSSVTNSNKRHNTRRKLDLWVWRDGVWRDRLTQTIVKHPNSQPIDLSSRRQAGVLKALQFAPTPLKSVFALSLSVSHRAAFIFAFICCCFNELAIITVHTSLITVDTIQSIVYKVFIVWFQADLIFYEFHIYSACFEE